jgi:tetratricopeptide (TPR) repeat protein
VFGEVHVGDLAEEEEDTRPGDRPTRKATTAILETYADDARQAISDYKRAMADEVEPARQARFEYEIGRLYDTVLGDLERASKHFDRALALTPEHLPTIVAARSVRQRAGLFDDALDLFDREVDQTGDRRRKAALLLAKARMLEDDLGVPERAREVYAAASELVDGDVGLLKALELAERGREAWDDLSDVYARTANAVSGDASHRAALVAARARVAELALEQPETASELYETALSIDPDAPGALDALKRLHDGRGRWRDLIRALRREADSSEDAFVRATALYRIGRIHAERLGNLDEAIASLAESVGAVPQATTLDALARLHEQAGNHRAQVEALTRLAGLTTDDRERLRLLHRIGELCHSRLADDTAAVAALEAALEIDPAHIPVLRVIAPIYQRAEDWDALVRLHEREAQVVTSTRRRAVAHARCAGILERTGDFPRATEHHERALALDPEMTSSFSALVRLYRRSAAHRKLVELYERALDSVDAERRIAYLFEIGELYADALDEAEQAEHAFRRILKLRPRHLGALHALQRVSEQAQRYPQMLDALQAEIEIVSDTRQLVSLLHRAAEVLDDYLDRRKEAVVHLRRVLDLDAHHLPTLAHLGRIYNADRRWKELVEVFERELEVTDPGPRHVAMLQKMGEIHAHELKDSDKAADCFRRALAEDPRYGPANRELTAILRRRKAWPELALLHETERDALEDTDARALAAVRVGELYEEYLEDLAAAEAAYAEASELRPDDRNTADALARVRTQLEHWADLATQLEDEAKEHSDLPLAIGALLRAGEVWSDHVDDVRRAIGAYVAVLERDPSHVGALLALEPLYRRAEAWPQLAALYRRQYDVLSDRGAKIAALTERARLLEMHRIGTREDLVGALDAILTLRPDDYGALSALERQALRGHDPRGLARVDARLAKLSESREMAAAHLTRQAESLEVAGNPEAMQLYRRALDDDRHARGALRGLARLAEVLGDDEALSQAARHEASIARRPELAADAWVRSGRIREDRLGDPTGAAEDYEQALDAWPDHTEAADALIALLLPRRKYAVLTERLSRAAAEAKDPARASVLWIEASRQYARHLDNLGAAISALKRLLSAQPDNGAAMLELAELYMGDRRVGEAKSLLEQVFESEADDAVAFRAHFLRAGLHEKDDEVDDAFKHYDAALELRADHVETLRRVASLQLRNGMNTAAVRTATRLLGLAVERDDRVTALLWIGQGQAGANKVSEAVEAFAEAVSLEGMSGTAGGELVRLAETREHWERYVEGLETFVADVRPELRERVALYQEIARTQDSRLQAPTDALSTLLRAVRDCDGDTSLRLMLGQQLRASGRHAKAVDHVQTLLMEDITRVEGWRLLAKAWGEMGLGRQRGYALSGLAVMGEATADEVAEARSWRSNYRALAPGSLLPAALHELLVAGDQQAATANLMAAVCDGLSKLRAPDLNAWGVASRDRIPPRSEHPVRVFTDRIAAIMGVEEYELYVHRHGRRGVGIENTPKPSLLLPLWLGELPETQQVFLVARAMVDLARGTYPVHLLPARDLEVALVASARAIVPGFAGPINAAELLDDRMRLVLRGLPRRKRRFLELAAPAYARAPRLNPSTVVEWIHQSARRIAAIVADDLTGAVSALRRTDDQQGGQTAADNSQILSDLLKCWISAPAMTLRQQVGLIATSQPGGTLVRPPR